MRDLGICVLTKKGCLNFEDQEEEIAIHFSPGIEYEPLEAKSLEELCEEAERKATPDQKADFE